MNKRANKRTAFSPLTAPERFFYWLLDITVDFILPLGLVGLFVYFF